MVAPDELMEEDRSRSKVESLLCILVEESQQLAVPEDCLGLGGRSQITGWPIPSRLAVSCRFPEYRDLLVGIPGSH